MMDGQQPLVILGGESVLFNTTNTYQSRLIEIGYTSDKECYVVIKGHSYDNVPTLAITKDCQEIVIIDHIGYRRMTREIAIVTSREKFCGAAKCYFSTKDRALQLIERICKDLGIKYTYQNIINEKKEGKQ